MFSVFVAPQARAQLTKRKKSYDKIRLTLINNLKALSLPPHDQARVKNALAVLNKVKTRIVRTRSDVDDIIKELLKAIAWSLGSDQTNSLE